MKNIFDTVKSGNLNDIGTSLNAAFGSKLGSLGDSINSGMGNISKGTSVQNNPLQGVGGLLGSAAVGGLLGALFGSKKPKKMAKNALKGGAAAAVGTLAWNFYQKWSSEKQAQAAQQTPQQTPQGATYGQQTQNPTTQVNTNTAYTAPAPLPPTDTAALLLLEAMVYAARADGHIDDAEKVTIHNAVQVLFPGQQMVEILDALLEKPVDPVGLASRVQNAEEARDLYRLSCAAIDIDSYMERSYLDGLAKALQLTETEKAGIEQEALGMRQAAAE